MLADHTFVQEQQLWLVERNELAEHEPRMAGGGAAAAAGWLLVAVGDDAAAILRERMNTQLSLSSCSICDSAVSLELCNSKPNIVR